MSREEQDRFSLQSQLKAEEAIKTGKFKKEIVPVTIKNRKEEIEILEDEFPKIGCTIAALEKLDAVFKKVTNKNCLSSFTLILNSETEW